MLQSRPPVSLCAHNCRLFLLISVFALGWPAQLESQEKQDPFVDPFSDNSDPRDPDEPFSDPFSNDNQADNPTSNDPGSITIEPMGRLKILGPGGVPNVDIISTLRLGLSHTSELSESLSLTTRDSEIRVEGHILGKDSFLARFDLAGDRSHGLLSEIWFDTTLAHGIHLTAGRIPGTLGLESFPGHERRISITPGFLDWAGGGTAWGVRSGGRWINGTVSGDLQLMLEDPVDVEGDEFGGYGILTRISVRPLSQFLFGGPSDPNRLWKDTSLFVSGRWDWEADGEFEIRSSGDLELLKTTDLHYDNIHWVRAGWRLPLSEYLQFENEWLRTGFFGVGPLKVDMPGEVTAFQVGLRARVWSDQPLPFALPHDLPGGDMSLDEDSTLVTAESDRENQAVDLLIRYEQLNSKSRLADLGLLEVGSADNDLESIRFALTRTSGRAIRWTLEGTWTFSDDPIILPDSSSSADNLFTFRCLLELGL